MTRRHLRLVPDPPARERQTRLTFGTGIAPNAEQDADVDHRAAGDDDLAARLEAIRLGLVRRGGVG